MSIPKMESALICHALRLKPGEELKSNLLQYVKNHKLRAAFIMSCVGSVRKATLRLADSVSVMKLDTNHEIVSLVGTVSGGSGHLHISLSDCEGKVLGGHLLGDAEIFTTAEIVIGELPHLEFRREPDHQTGYDELTVDPRDTKT